MDPAVALGLWLLKTAVAPDAYSRIVDATRSRSHVQRLCNEVRRSTHQKVGHRYRRWLRSEHTWICLVARTQDAYEDLVRTLADSEARRLLRERPRDLERATLLVNATIASFLPTLDPSTAVAVSEYRAEGRHAELLTRLDASTGFEERLERLPPAAAEILARSDHHRGTSERVVDALLRGDPRDTLTRWADARPDWLRDAPGSLILALGQLAQAYGLRRQAGRFFEEAADLGVDPPTWYARAALEAHATGDPDRCEALLLKADSGGTSGYPDVVRAAIAENGVAITEMVGEDEAASDPFVALLFAVGLGQRDADLEIDFLRRMIDRYPTYTNFAMILAELLLERSFTPASTSRDLDRQEAFRLAVAARDSRRRWRGDSGAAVDLACRAALTSGNFSRVIGLGTCGPEGEALPEEAAHPEVQFSVAQAATALGKHELLEKLASTSTNQVHHALITAELLVRQGAPPADVLGQYEAAWGHASNDADKAAVWMAASLHGVDPLPGAEELSQRDDDLPVLCHASQHIAAGRLSEAVALLRPHRTSEALRRLLVDAYIRQGDIDAAVAELLDSAKRFANLDHQVRAIEVLAASDRIAQAADLADQTLPMIAPHRPERTLLHEVGVAAAHDRQDWPEMEARARAWITEFGADRRRRWLLVMAIYNQVDPDRAWRIVQEGGPSFAPERSIEAQLWIALHARFRPSSETLSRILQIVERFPEDADIRKVAVNAFFAMGDKKQPIDADELEVWHGLIRARAESPAPDDTFIAISVPDDPEGLAEALRPVLEAQAQTVNSWLQRLRTELWPSGMLAMVAGRNYARTLAQRPLGWLPIAATDPATLEAELRNANSAIDRGLVVVDLSAVIVSYYVRERWPGFLAAFGTPATTAESRRDATMSADDFFPASRETLSWDLERGLPILHTLDEAVAARLDEQLKWVRDQVELLTLLPVERSVGGDEKDPSTFGPWMEVLRAARSNGAPLWADDVGLRALATSEGVSAFGTDSLLRALALRGTVSETELAAAFDGLRNEYCVDLPMDEQWIASSAQTNGWRAGPALLAMARGTSWVEPRRGFELWSEIATAATAHDSSTLPHWVHAAVSGIASSQPDTERATRLAAGVLVRAATLVASEAEEFARCAAAAEAAAAERDIPDPTELALSMLFDLLSQSLGPARAATHMAGLGSALADHHRAILRSILFGL